MTDNSTDCLSGFLSGCVSDCRPVSLWVIANPANEPIESDPSQSQLELLACPVGGTLVFQYMCNWRASAELMWPMIASNDWLPKIRQRSSQESRPIESKIANETEIGAGRETTRQDESKTKQTKAQTKAKSPWPYRLRLQLVPGAEHRAWRCWPTEPTGGACSGWLLVQWVCLPFVSGANCTKILKYE